MNKHLVRSCTCSHPTQDAIYGRGMRLHIAGHKDGYFRHWTCVVCGTRKDVQPGSSKIKLENAPGLT